MSAQRINIDDRQGDRPFSGALLNLFLAFLFLGALAAVAAEVYLRQQSEKVDPVNSWGYHDIEPIVKDNDGRRVMILGDSFVEGIAVDVQQTVGRRLEHHLDQQTDARVFALGKPGAGQADQLDMLDAHIGDIRPEAVVVYFLPANDIMNNSALLEMKATKPRYWLSYGKLERMPPQAPPPTKRSKILLVNEIRRRWDYRQTQKMRIEAGQGVPLDFRVYQKPLSEVWAEAWVVTELLLTTMRDHAEATGARFGVVIIPDRHELNDQFQQTLASEYPAAGNLEWDTRGPARRLEEFAKLEGIPLLDLYSTFKTAKTSEVFLEDGHWSVAGHELAARASADFVVELLDAPAPKTAFRTSNPGRKSKLDSAGGPVRPVAGE